MKAQRPLLLSAATVAVVAFGVTLFFSQLSIFAFLELKGFDLLLTLRGPLPVPDSIIIVAIDEPSMAEIGRQWPWPRSLHARLVQQLHRAGAKVIGFDILFAEPSQPAEDAELARILKANGNVVLVSALSVVNDPLFRQTIRIDPLPAFREVTQVGNPLISIDADGVVRRTRLLTPGLPSFALQVVSRYLSNPAMGTGVVAKGTGLQQRDLLREVLIAYRGPPKTIRSVSYYQALDYERMLPPGIFADKIVLVGRQLESTPEPQALLSDAFLTPFSWATGNSSAGVEIQANIISNVLEGHFITEPGKAGQWLLLLVLLLASLLVASLKPVAALLATVALAVLALSAAYLVFVTMNMWIPMVSGVIALGLVYGGHLLARSLLAERERRRLLEEINRDLEAKIAARTQELLTANQALSERHQQVETAYQELARTQEQLVHSEKMASLGLLVAGVAHELNNPISYVHSNLEFIEDYTERLASILQAQTKAAHFGVPVQALGNGQPESALVATTLKTLRELIASCRDGTGRVKKIVLDLRVFSRTDDVGLVMADLHEGIESTLNLLANQYQNRITVHRDYADTLPLVECYPGQINQVFMNLLQNVAQAISAQGAVWIQTSAEGGWVRIAIKDNGPGISEEQLPRIFDPFFTTKPVGAGTGLGLSISYGIVRKHGGTIRVASTVGEGTEFTLELPVRSIGRTIT